MKKCTEKHPRCMERLGFEDNCKSQDKEFPHYICTLKNGHKGNHLACGISDHNIKEWKNNEHSQNSK